MKLCIGFFGGGGGGGVVCLLAFLKKCKSGKRLSYAALLAVVGP